MIEFAIIAAICSLAAAWWFEKVNPHRTYLRMSPIGFSLGSMMFGYFSLIPGAILLLAALFSFVVCNINIHSAKT